MTRGSGPSLAGGYPRRALPDNGFETFGPSAHPIHVGKDFWHRLTGDESFYIDLINALSEVADEIDSSKLMEDAIDSLAGEIKEIFK